MAETQRTEISAYLMEEVRRIAREQGRSEFDVLNEAVAFFVSLRKHFNDPGAGDASSGRRPGALLGSPTDLFPGADPEAERWSDLGSIEEFVAEVARWQQENGVPPLSEEEASRIADEEIHAYRRGE